MAFNIGSSLGGASNLLSQWMTSFFVWGILLFIVAFGIVIYFIVRRNKKLKFPVLVQTLLGNGKIGVISYVGGWFGNKSILGGLYDYGGETVFKVKEPGMFGKITRRVLEVSSEDYHTINGRMGLIVIRKGDDPAILVPVSSVEITDKSREQMEAIAPADFRDAVNKIMDDATAETQKAWAKYIPIMFTIFMGIILLICIIVVINFSNQRMDKAMAYEKEHVKTSIVTASTSAPLMIPFLLFGKKKKKKRVILIEPRHLYKSYITG